MEHSLCARRCGELMKQSLQTCPELLEQSRRYDSQEVLGHTQGSPQIIADLRFTLKLDASADSRRTIGIKDIAVGADVAEVADDIHIILEDSLAVNTEMASHVMLDVMVGERLIEVDHRA